MEKFLPQQVAAAVNAQQTPQQQQQQQHSQTTKAFSVSEENRHYLKVFIQTYHNSPILWDTTLRDYTNRDKRAEAYQQLVPIYKYLKRDATLEDVKKKINTLRTNYRKELKVVEAARKEGNHYQPRCWTFYELDFLRNAEKFLAIDIKSETPSTPSPYNIFNDTSSHQGHFLDPASYGYRMNIVGSMSPTPSISEMFHKSFGQPANVTQQQNQNTSPLGLPGGIQNSTTSTPAHYPMTTPHQFQATARNSNKRLKTASSSEGTNATGQNSSPSSPNEMINMACNYLSSTYPEEESLARTWTFKLKRLPREQRLFAEKFINDILFEAENGTLHRGSMQLNAMEPYVRFQETPTDDSSHDKPQSPHVATGTTATQELNTNATTQAKEAKVDTHSSSITSNENSDLNNSNSNTFNTYN